MSRKKAKKMHIKRYKYHQRPKGIEVNVLLYFLNHFDESILKVVDFISTSIAAAKMWKWD